MKLKETLQNLNGKYAYVVYTLGKDENGQKYLDQYFDSYESFLGFAESEFSEEHLLALLNADSKEDEETGRLDFWFNVRGAQEYASVSVCA